jgi:hypothetical protein
MTGAELEAEIERLGFRNRAAFARLIELYSCAPLGNTTVYRWCDGRRPVPAWAVGYLRLFEELPRAKRARILAEIARPPPPPAAPL